MKIAGALLSAAIVTMALAAPARAEQPSLTVSVFQGMQNLPLFAAQQKGFFAEHGLSVDLEITPSSDAQRAGLADGKYEIIHCGVDNGVAMADVANVDVAAVIGGDSGFNRLIVQPDIHAVTDLRGKTVIVDAPDTAYAFQLYEMLKRGGLNKGDYNIKSVGATSKRLVDIQQNKNDKASMLNPPFAFTAENGGLKDEGSAVSVIGAYQATAGIVLRSWAKEHPDTLVKYLQAYIEGLRYALDPKNKDEATKMLADGLKLPHDVAAATYAVATDPVEGLAKDGRFDGPGFDNVLRLRADWTGRAPGPASSYIDLSYYEQALVGLR